MGKTNYMHTVIEQSMKGLSLDDKGKLKIVDEAAHAAAKEALSKLILEKRRGWWSMLEAADDRLGSIRDQIRFEEMNADPSRLKTTPIGNTSAPAVRRTPANTFNGQDVDGHTGATPGPTMESLLDSDDLDLSKIFENFDEAEGDDENVNGDDEFENLQMGVDDDGMGDVQGDVGDKSDIDAVGGNEPEQFGSDRDELPDDDLGGEDFDDQSDDLMSRPEDGEDRESNGEEIDLSPLDDDFGVDAKQFDGKDEREE